MAIIGPSFTGVLIDLIKNADFLCAHAPLYRPLKYLETERIMIRFHSCTSCDASAVPPCSLRGAAARDSSDAAKDA
jgi:hypothetical protein